MEEEHEHDYKLVGTFINDKCIVCKGDLVANEVEILNQFYEVGGYCDNKECFRYLLLTV